MFFKKSDSDRGQRILFCVTTFNQLSYTKLFLDSLEHVDENFDLLFVDDVSTDDTVQYLRGRNEEVVSKETFKGLTHSWHVGYQRFREEGYDALVLANNDILIPSGALTPFFELLGKHPLVVPMSTPKGVGHNKMQDITKFYDLDNELVASPDNYQDVQIAVSKTFRLRRTKRMRKFNGFFFGVNRDIISSEFSDGFLFDPGNEIVGQEDDLRKRLRQKPVLALRSFIFHYKGVSTMSNEKGPLEKLPDDKKDPRENLPYYHE